MLRHFRKTLPRFFFMARLIFDYLISFNYDTTLKGLIFAERDFL